MFLLYTYSKFKKLAELHFFIPFTGQPSLHNGKGRAGLRGREACLSPHRAGGLLPT